MKSILERVARTCRMMAHVRVEDLASVSKRAVQLFQGKAGDERLAVAIIKRIPDQIPSRARRLGS
jgi:hypothetical protein